MDAKTDEKTRTAANPLASHHVRPDEMGWDTARFPGCATKTLFFDNMSERAAKILREDIESKGPVRIRDVDEAQMIIVTAAKDLAAKGEINIAEPGGEDQLVY